MKLAEILPLESADYCWGIDDETLHYNNSPYPCAWKDYTCKEYYIPCWSLAALLEILPKNFGRFYKTIGWYDDAWHCGYMDEDSEVNEYFTSSESLIDACYEMILKLNELKGKE